MEIREMWKGERASESSREPWPRRSVEEAVKETETGKD